MKKLLNESEKKVLLNEREQEIIKSFAKTFNSIKRINENEVSIDEGWKDILAGGLISLGMLGSLKGQNPDATNLPRPTTIQAVGVSRDASNKITYSDNQIEVEVRVDKILVFTSNKFLVQSLHGSPDILKSKQFDDEYVFVFKKDESAAKFIDSKIALYQDYLKNKNTTSSL